MPVDDARRVIEDAVAARVFPAASAEIGATDGVIWQQPFGTLTFDRDAPAAVDRTVFDLASLTKPMATATIAMAHIDAGALALDAPVADFFHEWRGHDREAVTVRDLLEHASGLPARLIDPPPPTRREFEHDICQTRLEYEPRSRSVYSDLGFILLGFIIEHVGAATLADQLKRPSFSSPLDLGVDDVFGFAVPAEARTSTAPTEPMADDPRRGRRLVAEVHDNYAAALGGVAGHAGLFATASAAGAFARVLLRSVRGESSLAAPFSPETMRIMTARSIVPGSSRALGWDTMLTTSSCGTRMSPRAFGHVGYTGTSLWIDPARGRYFVLLTNRACGGGTLEAMRTVRRAFHDALGDL